MKKCSQTNSTRDQLFLPSPKNSLPETRFHRPTPSPSPCIPLLPPKKSNPPPNLSLKPNRRHPFSLTTTKLKSKSASPSFLKSINLFSSHLTNSQQCIPPPYMCRLIQKSICSGYFTRKQRNNQTPISNPAVTSQQWEIKRNKILSHENRRNREYDYASQQSRIGHLNQNAGNVRNNLPSILGPYPKSILGPRPSILGPYLRFASTYYTNNNVISRNHHSKNEKSFRNRPLDITVLVIKNAKRATKAPQHFDVVSSITHVSKGTDTTMAEHIVDKIDTSSVIFSMKQETGDLIISRKRSSDIKGNWNTNPKRLKNMVPPSFEPSRVVLDFGLDPFDMGLWTCEDSKKKRFFEETGHLKSSIIKFIFIEKYTNWIRRYQKGKRFRDKEAHEEGKKRKTAENGDLSSGNIKDNETDAELNTTTGMSKMKWEKVSDKEVAELQEVEILANKLYQAGSSLGIDGTSALNSILLTTKEDVNWSKKNEKGKRFRDKEAFVDGKKRKTANNGDLCSEKIKDSETDVKADVDINTATSRSKMKVKRVSDEEVADLQEVEILANKLRQAGLE